MIAVRLLVVRNGGGERGGSRSEIGRGVSSKQERKAVK